MVFVFATGTMMNANSLKKEVAPDNCFQEAWDYGTDMGTSEYSQWFFMNEYYGTHCANK